MRLWLPPLVDLAGRFGVDAVDRTCLELFGFPAVLITGGSEVREVRKTLEGS